MKTIKKYNYEQKHLGRTFHFDASIVKDDNAYYLKCNDVVVNIKSPVSGENLLKQLFFNVIEVPQVVH
ncbi:MAG: hypothetical protein AAGI07_03750 [Bacteroidota bacterium]